MADFGNPNQELAKFNQKLKDRAAAAGVQPIDTTVATAAPTPPVAAAPVTSQATETTKTDVPTQQAPVAPVEQTLVDPKVTTTEPLPKVDEEVEAWDTHLTPTAPIVGPIDIEELSSALKLDGVKSKDDLVAQFTQRETRIKELETAQQQQFLDIPEELREVVDVSRKGGDWRAHLGARIIDYSKVDPIQLFEREVENDPSYRKADGTIDQDAVDLTLSQIPDAVKRVNGEVIKRTLMAEQAQKRSQLVAAAEQRRLEFNKNLAEAVRNIPTTLSKEKIGVVLEPKHADVLYQGIRDGSLIKKHLGNIDVSGVDSAKLARTIAIAEWGENFITHNRKQGETAGRKSMLAEKQNVQLNTPTIPVNPSVTGEKPKTAADKLRERVGTPQPGVRTL